VVAATAYVLSATMLWSFSEGRLSLLVVLAVLPLAWDRIDAAFARRAPEHPFRFGIGLGVALSIGAAFAPAIVLPVALFALVNLVAGRRRDRGSALVALAALAAAALAFPVVIAASGDPASALTSEIGTTDPWSLLRLAPGTGPGTWAVAAFLPIAAIVCFAGAGDPQRGRAWRALIVAVSGTLLAWASVAGQLPVALSNAPMWIGAAAVAESALLAYGLSTFGKGLERQAFGARQLGVAVLAVVLSVGIAGQALQVTFAEWAVGPGGLPPAWPVIASTGQGPFRILWLGEPDGDRFPAPGGDPISLAEAGERTVRFGLTDRDGVSALDEGRARSGTGYDELHAVLERVLAGGTRHAGALLGPFGIRFVIAEDGDLPPGVAERLTEQLDLDRLPAGGRLGKNSLFRQGNQPGEPIGFNEKIPQCERAQLACANGSGEPGGQCNDRSGFKCLIHPRVEPVARARVDLNDSPGRRGWRSAVPRSVPATRRALSDPAASPGARVHRTRRGRWWALGVRPLPAVRGEHRVPRLGGAGEAGGRHPRDRRARPGRGRRPWRPG
jgi:hypothetical protein